MVSTCRFVKRDYMNTIVHQASKVLLSDSQLLQYGYGINVSYHFVASSLKLQVTSSTAHTVNKQVTLLCSCDR